MEETKTKSSKPAVAGVLSIVAGGLSIFGALLFILGILLFIPFAASAGGPGPIPELEKLLHTGILDTALVIAVIYLLIVGILPVIGGICAVHRKKWGLSLTGSAIAIFGSTPLGIATLVLNILSRNEFA